MLSPQRNQWDSLLCNHIQEFRLCKLEVGNLWGLRSTQRFDCVSSHKMTTLEEGLPIDKIVVKGPLPITTH